MTTPAASQLSAISDPALRQLANRGVVRSFRKGTVLINEGDVGDTLYVILAGRVQIDVADESGNQMILGTRDAGDSVGEMAMDGEPRSASVRCLTDCVFSMVTRKTLGEAIRADPDFALSMMLTLIARARLATSLVKDLALRDVYGRVARLLMRLATEQSDGELAVNDFLSQAEIAKRVGASRDMVNRIFRELTNGGYLKMSDGRIILPMKRLPTSF